MRKSIYLFLIVALPTVLLSSDNDRFASSYLVGNYFDAYSGTEIRISQHRRGIKAKVNNKRWRTYYFVGNGVYDDYRGRVIVNLGYGEIKYVCRYRRNALVLSKIRRGDQPNRSGPRDWDNYHGDRSYGYDVNPYCGTWRSPDIDGRLHIERHGSGFRARNDRGPWTYYESQRDGSFRDPRGNRYYFDDRDLIWSSATGRGRLRFRKC